MFTIGVVSLVSAKTESDVRSSSYYHSILICVRRQWKNAVNMRFCEVLRNTEAKIGHNSKSKGRYTELPGGKERPAVKNKIKVFFFGKNCYTIRIMSVN